MRAFRDIRENRRRFIGFLVASTALAFALAVVGPVLAAGSITNTTLRKDHATLAEALAEARDGDAITVSGGVHEGNFIVDHRIALRGGDGAILDGVGKGTVPTIRAAGVSVEGLAIRGSAISASPYDLWGEAGVAVQGDRAMLAGLDVSGNDWGVIFFGGQASTLRGSNIADNVRDGVRILGGRGHLVEANVVNRNMEGVSLIDWYPDREAPVLQSNDPVKLKDYIDKKANAPRAVDHRVSNNEVRGNAFYGVVVTADAHDNTVADNRVFNTGKEKPMDMTQIAAVEAGFAAISGMDVEFSHDTYGSGILLSCLAHDNAVLRNEVHDNLAHGVIVDLADRTVVEANIVKANRTGILVISSDAGAYIANRASDNSEYGIRIGSNDAFRSASDANLVACNDLVRNPVNAFDSSGRQMTEADVLTMIDTLPLPKAVKDQILKNPSVRAQWIAGWLANHEPGANRWDDGAHGNHHDDFDEPAEGFVDRDQDGVSEIGKPIPGGPSLDRHPLLAAPVDGKGGAG